MGTIGIPAFIARWNPPFLNGSMSGVSDMWRVPSGNIHSENPALFIRSPAASMERMARALFPRSTKMFPARCIQGPRGEYWRDFLAITATFLGSALGIGIRGLIWMSV